MSCVFYPQRTISILIFWILQRISWYLHLIGIFKQTRSLVKSETNDILKEWIACWRTSNCYNHLLHWHLQLQNKHCYTVKLLIDFFFNASFKRFIFLMLYHSLHIHFISFQECFFLSLSLKSLFSNFRIPFQIHAYTYFKFQWSILLLQFSPD